MWQSLPKLAQVREVQKELASRNGLTYWDWASIMPAKCGANKWATLSSPLMAKDRVHFTIEGYKKSAHEFLHVLKPIVASKVAGREQPK